MVIVFQIGTHLVPNGSLEHVVGAGSITFSRALCVRVLCFVFCIFGLRVLCFVCVVDGEITQVMVVGVFRVKCCASLDQLVPSRVLCDVRDYQNVKRTRKLVSRHFQMMLILRMVIMLSIL